MKYFISIAALILSLSLHSKVYDQQFGTDNFYRAKTSLNFIKFDIEGTRAKVFPADVLGMAKRFSIKINIKKNIVNSAEVRFKVEDLDTDLAVRNKKLRNFCFNYEKYPEVTIKAKNYFRLKAKSQNVKAVMTIKGRKKPIMLKLNSYKNGKKLYLKGSSELSLKELEIPDPSTFFNKISDKVNISFSVAIDL